MSSRRQDIQMLRGLAVLAVVLFHAFPQYFGRGYLGVDVFFVISGYLITPLIIVAIGKQGYKQKIKSVNNFVIRRFLRLGPAFGTVLLVFLPIFIIFGRFDDARSVFGQAVFSLAGVGNVGAYLFQGNYFQNEFNPLIHTWSLAVEEQIYLTLPFLLFLSTLICDKKKCSRIIIIQLSIISIVLFMSPSIMSPIFSKFGVQLPAQASFYLPISRFWEFGIGAIISMKELQLRFNKIRIVSSQYAGYVAIVVLISMLFYNCSFKEIEILVPLVTSWIILCNKKDDEISYIISWLGDRSYSIYLFHMPMLYLARFSPNLSNYISNDSIRIIVALVSSLLLSLLNYRYVEQKFRVRNPSLKVDFKKVFTLAILFLFIPQGAYITSYALFSNGFREPYDPRKNMYGDSECGFWIPNSNVKSDTQFNDCYEKYGKAILVAGDSHAMNIYNSIAREAKREKVHNFVVGIADGGCRFWPVGSNCLDYLNAFLNRYKDKVLIVFYHQSGSYLIRDKLGRYDSQDAFDSPSSYKIDEDGIAYIWDKLEELSKFNDTKFVWIGPYTEWRSPATPLAIVLHANERINANGVEAIHSLDLMAEKYRKKSNIRSEYVSLGALRDLTRDKIRFRQCLLFRDTDHWSKCGEELFGSSILKLLKL